MIPLHSVILSKTSWLPIEYCKFISFYLKKKLLSAHFNYNMLLYDVKFILVKNDKILNTLKTKTPFLNIYIKCIYITI